MTSAHDLECAASASATPFQGKTTVPRSLQALTWHLSEQPRQFELGQILNCVITDALEPKQIGDLGIHHAGLWECNLADDSLIWSGGVYDIFGLSRGCNVAREDAVAMYSPDSRAMMERLRSYAISHRVGFTLDAEIRPVGRRSRWIRLITAPAFDGEKVTRLHGLILVI